MYTKENWQLWAFILFGWAVFPVAALWLFITHPGRCALIVKRLITGEWK